MKKSLITMVAALALVGVVGAGATLAYLTDTTEVVTNTFTMGKVDIDLTEETPDGTVTGNEYKDLTPGEIKLKNPQITVKAGSKACYVFAKVENTTKGKVIILGTNAKGEDVVPVDQDEAIESFGWKKLDTNVYYKEVPASEKDNVLDVFRNVKISETVDENGKNENANLEGKIEITAYAIQLDGIGTAEEAWAEVK